MAGSQFQLDASQVDRLQKTMTQYAGHAGQIVDEVLHNEGGKLISEEIMRLLPESGRTWAGKKPAAKQAKPFMQENGSLSVTVKTKPAYNYLYFPDDGTNTRRHIGYEGVPREFMRKGGESQADKIIDLCIAKLTKIGE